MYKTIPPVRDDEETKLSQPQVHIFRQDPEEWQELVLEMSGNEIRELRRNIEAEFHRLNAYKQELIGFKGAVNGALS